MGRGKELFYYNGALKGKYLTDKDCDALDKLRELNDNNGRVDDLKNIIYCLPAEDVEKIKADKSADFIDKRIGELEDPQTIGVAYMYFAKRLVLGDSVGLGKTVEVCGLCNLISQKYAKEGHSFRFLFLTEKTLVNQARDEIIKFTGEYVELLRGEKRYVDDFAFENSGDLQYSVVGTHSLINSKSFQEYIRMHREEFGCNPFDAVIVDESSILGNTSTQTYKNAMQLIEGVDWVIAMNATPFESNLGIFYGQLNFCDSSLLPPKTTFSKLYEVTKYNPFRGYNVSSGKYKNADVFRNQVKYRYFARTRKSIGAIMEGCTADVVVTELSPIQKELLSKTSIPNMVYDCPSYFNKDLVDDPVNSPKLGALLSIINGKFKHEGSIIVYSPYKESQRGIYNILIENGISCEIMNGDTSLEERKELITKFQLGDIRVLVTNVQKGLNFNHCNACIFYSYDPNSNKMVQFEGRMTRSVNIINKHVVIITTRGKELKRLRDVVAEKAKASDLFAGSDFSCVLSLLLENGVLDNV